MNTKETQEKLRQMQIQFLGGIIARLVLAKKQKDWEQVPEVLNRLRAFKESL